MDIGGNWEGSVVPWGSWAPALTEFTVLACEYGYCCRQQYKQCYTPSRSSRLELVSTCSCLLPHGTNAAIAACSYVVCMKPLFSLQARNPLTPSRVSHSCIEHTSHGTGLSAVSAPCRVLPTRHRAGVVAVGHRRAHTRLAAHAPHPQSQAGAHVECRGPRCISSA